MAICMVPLTCGAEDDEGSQVWQWRDDCDRPATLQVAIDSGTTRLLDVGVPLCKGERGPGVTSRPPVDFPAKGMADRFDVSRDALLTGSVWVAGGEADGITLGISFQTDQRVLLNPSYDRDSSILFMPL